MQIWGFEWTSATPPHQDHVFSVTFIVAAVILQVRFINRPQDERAVVLQLWIVSIRQRVVLMGSLTLG
jgi:uncharacterized membrane protein